MADGVGYSVMCVCVSVAKRCERKFKLRYSKGAYIFLGNWRFERGQRKGWRERLECIYIVYTVALAFGSFTRVSEDVEESSHLNPKDPSSRTYGQVYLSREGIYGETAVYSFCLSLPLHPVWHPTLGRELLYSDHGIFIGVLPLNPLLPALYSLNN